MATDEPMVTAARWMLSARAVAAFLATAALIAVIHAALTSVAFLAAHGNFTGTPLGPLFAGLRPILAFPFGPGPTFASSLVWGFAVAAALHGFKHRPPGRTP